MVQFFIWLWKRLFANFIRGILLGIAIRARLQRRYGKNAKGIRDTSPFLWAIYAAAERRRRAHKQDTSGGSAHHAR